MAPAPTSKQGEQANDVQRLCREADALLERGEIDAAGEKYSAACERDGRSGRAVGGLGRVLHRHCVSVLKQLEGKMVETAPDQADTPPLGLSVGFGYRGRAGHETRVGVWTFASIMELLRSTIEKLEESIGLGYESADCHAELGELWVRVRDREQALPHLKRALQLSPQHVHAHFWLGMFFRGMDRFPEAIEHFGQAAKLSPRSAESHYELGSAYYKNRQVGESIPCFKAATELNPKYADALCNLATSLFEVGKRREAMEAYRRFIALDPHSHEARKLQEAFPELGAT